MAAVLPESGSVLGHIFRRDEGHIPDTPENRALLFEVANDPRALLGADRHGNEWFVRIAKDGRQVWTQVRNGRIIDGGINDAHRAHHQETGLKRP